MAPPIRVAAACLFSVVAFVCFVSFLLEPPQDNQDGNPINRGRSLRTNVAVVLSSYNEETHLNNSLHVLTRELRNWVTQSKKGYNFTVYLIDDGSSDNTLGILKSFCNQSNVVPKAKKVEEGIYCVLLPHKINKGLDYRLLETYSLVTSSREAFDFVLKTDSDDDFDQVRG